MRPPNSTSPATAPTHTTPRLLVGLALLGASVAACGGETTIRLTADRTTITAGGIDHALITAEALLDGDPVAQGTSISFSTTGGSFAPDEELSDTTAAADGSGRAMIKLYSGAKQGTGTVTASFSDSVTGLDASASLMITFGSPTQDRLPVGGKLRLTCDAVNIGALREPLPDIEVTCQLTAQTRDGQTIPAAALNPAFRTEAGSLTPAEDASTGERVFLYSPKGGASAPKDVPPDPTVGEPSYADPNGRLRNPRDGLVTLIAVVDGEEAFTDTNGNGQYDQGEPFVDSAEPFVDENDNDTRDVDESFIDTNGNGQWDMANGYWDQLVKLMAIYKLLWTGPLNTSNQTSRIERMASTIMDGGKLELSAYALDANMNPIAAFQNNQDYLEWTLSSGGDATTIDPTTPPMDNSLGFSFDKAANTERQRWLILSNTFRPKPYKLTIEDGYPGDGDQTPTSFTVSVHAYVSPGPTTNGDFLPQLTETIDDRVQGTCN